MARGSSRKRDRTLLFGATSASLEANVSVTDVGVAQEISAPKQLDSYSSLQLALSALGEAVRRTPAQPAGELSLNPGSARHAA